MQINKKEGDIINFYQKKVLKRIENFCKTIYFKLDRFKMDEGEGVFNNKCHNNAVQKYFDNRDKVYLCLTMNDKTFPVVHFINKNKDNKFIDNTLGYKYNYYDYHIVREVNKEEFENIEDVLDNTKKLLINLHSNFILRKLFRVRYNLI